MLLHQIWAKQINWLVSIWWQHWLDVGQEYYKHNFFCLKSVQMRNFFWSAFPCIQSKYRKIRTRKKYVSGHFSRSVSSHHWFFISFLKLPLHKICKNTGFHWPVFPHIRTESKNSNRVSENPCSGIFYKVCMIYFLLS